MLDGQTIVEQNNGRTILHFPEEHLSNQFLSRLIQSGVYVRDFTEILPSLNEIFIRTVEEQGMTIDQHSNHEA